MSKTMVPSFGEMASDSQVPSSVSNSMCRAGVSGRAAWARTDPATSDAAKATTTQSRPIPADLPQIVIPGEPPAVRPGTQGRRAPAFLPDRSRILGRWPPCGMT